MMIKIIYKLVSSLFPFSKNLACRDSKIKWESPNKMLRETKLTILLDIFSNKEPGTRSSHCPKPCFTQNRNFPYQHGKHPPTIHHYNIHSNLKLLIPGLFIVPLISSSRFLFGRDSEDMTLAEATFLARSFHLASSFLFSCCIFNWNCLSHSPKTVMLRVAREWDH